MIASLDELAQHNGYSELEPIEDIGFPFKPATTGNNYLSWPILKDLFIYFSPGVQTARDDLVVDIEKPSLIARMKSLF